MVCKTCGSTLTPNDQFCRYCGTTVPAAPQEPPVQQAPIFTPTYTPVNQSAPNPLNNTQNTPPVQNAYVPEQRSAVPQQPMGAKRHLKPSAPRKPGKGLIIGGAIAAAVLVIALVVVLIISGNPTVKVATAFKNTADSFTKMADVWHAEDASAFSKKEALSYSMEAEVDHISDDLIYYYSDAFSGLGVSLDMDVDVENREMGMMATASMGSTDLVTGMISVEDDMVYLGLPDFLDDFYGFSTETIMADLDDMGAGLGEAAQISFNIFDMIQIVRDYSGDTEEAQAEITEAATKLAGELVIEKAGKSNVKVGGESISCAAYTVTIPQDALEEFFETVEDVSTSSDPLEMIEELFKAMSLPDDIIEELMYEVSYNYTEPDFSDMYEVLDILGDIELQVYVKGNKVAGVCYEEKIEGSKLEIGMYIGGDRYGDCIDMEIKIDGEKMTIQFEGDHFAKDGAFTDKMTVKVDGEKVTMNTEYDPKSGELSVRLGDSDVYFQLEGTYNVTDTSWVLDLNELSMVEYDEEMFSIALRMEMSDYEKRVRVSDARLIGKMTEDDIMTLMDEVEGNAMEWATELMAKCPELLEALGLY